MKELEDQTILVTGATGFIGRHLVNRLRAIHGTRLILLCRKSSTEAREGEVWVNCDLDKLSGDSWRGAGISSIDTVFHLGAFTPKAGSEGDAINEIFQANLIGTRALLESMPNLPQKIVFSSTLDVYSQSQDEPILTERSNVAPVSLYGASKVFCENLVQMFARQHGCGYAILRYGHIYGPGEEAYRKLIPITIENLLRDQKPVLYGDGCALRDFLYVDDAVEATIRAAKVSLGSIDAVNIVRGESAPIREIIELLISIIGGSQQIEYLSDKPSGRSLRFSDSRMREVFGAWEKVSLAEGLRREVERFRQLNIRREQTA